MIWHGERCLFLYCEVCLEMLFLYIYFCIGLKHFFNIMHLLCIASHITCTFCSEVYTNCHVYMSMCLYSFQFFHFVLHWNAWWELWMKWYGMTDEFVLVDCRLQLHVYEVDITFMMEHDGKFTCIWDGLILVQFVSSFLSCQDVEYAIHDMCRSISQKFYIC